MGNLELALALKYGIPLAIKLLANGKNEAETVKVVTDVIVDLENGSLTDEGIADTLVNATPEQAKGIIEGFFGLITGVAGAFGGLVKALFKVFGS